MNISDFKFKFPVKSLHVMIEIHRSIHSFVGQYPDFRSEGRIYFAAARIGLVNFPYRHTSRFLTKLDQHRMPSSQKFERVQHLMHEGSCNSAFFRFVLLILFTVIGVFLANLVSVSWLELLASAALASLAVPLVALVYAVYIKNKVQALMMLKPLQVWGGVPTLLFFVSTPWQWIGSVPGPLYYPMRLFWSATQGQTEWWLMVPGVVILGAMILWLLHRFERTVYA